MKPWMMSNRQPWPWALVNGLIRTKTRSVYVSLPPIGATVYLHASKALWFAWRDLSWVQDFRLDVPRLDRGGIVGVATVSITGPTWDVMPGRDMLYFEMNNGMRTWSCADERSIVFKNIRAVEFFPCPGAQVPTRRLPFDPSELKVIER
jgi:hypothetical protein